MQNREHFQKAKGQHPLEMSPSAFRFFEDPVRFPGHSICHPVTTQSSRTLVRVSWPFRHHDAVKSFLGAIRELVTGLLAAFVYSLLLEDFSSVIFDNTQSHASFLVIHEFLSVEIMYLLWKWNEPWWTQSSKRNGF
jgi:hypothetical protein